MTIETVFKQRNSVNTVNFADSGVPFDFSSITRAVVKFEGSEIEADTDVDSALIDFLVGGGDITFSFGGLAIDAGEYPVSLIIYDPLHLNGQILAHAENNVLYFRFLDPI